MYFLGFHFLHMYIPEKNHRGFYTRTHVLSSLLNELRKIDKMRGLPSILLLFRNNFNRFNITGALILDSTYYMTLKLL